MPAHGASVQQDVLDAQKPHWERTLSGKPDMFGEQPSESARKAAELFEEEGIRTILELGGGQGRDTIFFAQNRFHVAVLDYAAAGLKAINEKARALGLSTSVSGVRHDVRQPLPFRDETFEACYSHMLYCMALTTAELEFLSAEVRRVLRPGGLNVYTVRHTGDAHYRTGIHRGEDMYEVGGFIVHFFSREKVEQLARGYEVVRLEEFEEGGLPRKLFVVTLRKQAASPVRGNNGNPTGGRHMAWRWMILGIVLGLSAWAWPHAVEAQATETQSVRGGGVTVAVRLVSGPGEPPTFRVSLDTHTVNLDIYDFGQITRLRDGRGGELALAAVEDVEGGGHHRSAVVRFAWPEPKPKTLELVVKDIAGVPERLFRWATE